MRNIQLLSVGKLKEPYLRMASAEYEKRLSGYCKLTIHELPEAKLMDNPTESQIASALQSEGQSILQKVLPGAFLVALCIEGEMLSSEQLAARIAKLGVDGVSAMAFVIGGSFGLSDAVKERANLKLSYSRMTFPHQLARIMLLEQIYRAESIIHNAKYHK